MTGFIYFMKPVGHVGPIKIGYAADPSKRLASCQSWSPSKLEIVAVCPGDIILERNIHGCLADCHSHGEWFHPTARVLALLYKVKQGEAIKDAIDLNDVRGSILSACQRATRAINGTASKRLQGTAA